MQDQPGVLQQRIEVVALPRKLRQQAGEGIGGGDQKGQESRGHQAEDAQHPRQQRLG